MRSGRGQSDDLGVHAGFLQNLFAVIDVTMAAHGDVVVAGIVQAGITLGVVGDAHGAGALLDGLDVLRRIVVIVEVNDRHLRWLSWDGDATRQSTRGDPAESSPVR